MTPFLPLMVTCGMCLMAANTFLIWIHEGATKEELVERIVTLCVTMNLQKEHICKGIAEAHADMAIWIVKNKRKTDNPITAEAVCGFAMFPQCELKGDQFKWTLDLEFAGPKPALLEETAPAEDAPKLKVLHLTDVHIDPQYAPGGNADCDEPVCCRKSQGEPKEPSGAAGYWGDYRDCDSPMHTLRNMLNHAANTHADLDYVIFTGDIIDHFLWATGKQVNTETIKEVMAEMRNAFPVPLLPIIGNHESHPVNTFSGHNPEIPPELTSDWVNELAAELWLPGLTEAAKETITKGGYYAHEVKPGLVVLAINNNYCYHLNWWLLYDNKDPAGQLKWLAEQLLEAEKSNKKVHILAHIPTGSNSCWDIWAKEYRKILHRFENTVVAQFHGHTHNDHFNIFYDLEDPNRATSVAFVGGGATAYSDMNPNYKVYHVDGVREGSTFRVLDHETWYFNLTEANVGGSETPPNWKKLYSFKETFGLSSLHPKELDNFVHSLAKSTELQDKYYGYYVKLGDKAMEKGCEGKCRKDLVCEIVTSVHGDKTKCDSLPFDSNNALSRRKRKVGSNTKEAANSIEAKSEEAE